MENGICALTFYIGEERLAVPARLGDTVLESARRADVFIDAPCSGNGSCGKCKVRIAEGLVDSQPSRHIEDWQYSGGFRLACLSRVSGDAGVELPLTAQWLQSRIRVADLRGKREGEVFASFRRRLAQAGCAGDSGMSVREVSLAPPSIDDAGADGERLLSALAGGGQSLRDLRLSLAALKKLPLALRAGGFRARCVLRSEGSGAAVLDILDAGGRGEDGGRGSVDGEDGSGDGGHDRDNGRGEDSVCSMGNGRGRGDGELGEDGRGHGEDDESGREGGGRAEPGAVAGLAIDIGTTSVSALLVDLLTGDPLSSGSSANRQIRYGADVISRIIESARPGGMERLQRAIWHETLEPLIRGVCREAGVGPQSVHRVAFAANTTMTHLLLGVSAESIRLEPYVPAFFSCDGLCGADLPDAAGPGGSGGGALFRADAEILIAPSIGSYVGGDITAGVFASGMLMSDAISLFIDLGTNGELVVGNEDFLLACACSAGPAFEGGDISCGMRASDGAIESFGADPETLEPSYSVIGGMKPAGVCGSGLIDIVAALFRAGAIDARGRLARDHARIRADAGGMRRFVVAEPSQTETGAEIAVTESDIDNFVRAKAAIFSAIRTLLQIAGLEAGEIENAYIAGGIGSGINIASAVAVGMLPNLPEGRYRYVGNTSLMGAYAMATSRGAAASVARIGGAMTYIELSSHPAYMDEFIAACFLPHTDASLFAAPAAGA